VDDGGLVRDVLHIDGRGVIRYIADVLTIESVLEMLRRKAGSAGSQRELADKIGISPQYLSDILAGKRQPGAAVERYLGLERRIVYEKVKP
jgi:predicted transcriptional regulator